MKKLALSIVLVNLLAGCGAIHTPFDHTPEPKKEPAAATSATETAKVDSAPTPEVNAQSLDKPATTETALPGEAAPQAEAVTATTETPAKVEAAPNAATADPLNDPANALSKRNVHFAFDKDAIQEADKPTVQAHGEYLGSHADKKIRVEGNADERGSSEYNLALGQRRANNARKALVLSGAKSDQIEAISYGEEKPLALGHDEASWAQNRRADIVYK